MNKTKKAIIIGSGAGGLVASAYLSKAGFQVEVLEKAPQIGGYLHTFSLNNYHFDPGIHYIGECHKNGLVDNIFSGIDLDVENLFCEMDTDGFDIYRFPGLEVKRCKGSDAYRDRLVELFPKETKGIDRFFEHLKLFVQLQSKMMNPSFQLSDLSLLCKILSDLPGFLKIKYSNYGSYLGHITKNKRLKAVLSANLGCIGLPPSKISTILGLALFNFYNNGAYFPKRGGNGICDAIKEVAESKGAVFRTKSEVKRILIKNEKTIGVVLKNGEQINADIIISAIEPAITFGQLIEYKDLPKELCHKVIHMKPSVGAFYVFLGLKRDLKKHGLGAFNIWDHYTFDMEEIFKPALTGVIGNQFSLFSSFNSLKDNTGSLAPAGCSTLEIISFVPYEAFSRWDGLASNKRGQEYQELKEKVGEKIVNTFIKNHPDIVGDIEVKNFASPVTNSFWVNAVKGGAYGPAMCMSQTMGGRFTTKTCFKNLFLAGSGVFGAGVPACFVSGMTAAKIAENSIK